MCDEGYALAADGTCKTCSNNAYSNCAKCTDILSANGTSSTSTCLECMDGYTMQDDQLACLSCQISSTSNCATCIDKPGKFCQTCSANFKLSVDQETCGFDCHRCVGPTCNTFSSIASTALNVSVCDSCWVIGTKNAAGQELITRGCNRNSTCSGTYKEEFCEEVNGVTRCMKCCEGANCNNFDLAMGAGAGTIKISAVALLLAALLATFF